MNSVCVSSCVNDAHVPVRASYRNLYMWPESDAEFVRSMSSISNGHSRVVDSISSRQMYLRSYTFFRKETVPEKTVKYLEGVKEKVAHRKQKMKKRKTKKNKMSCAVLFRMIFSRLLSCTTRRSRVDVADCQEES